MGRKVVGFIAAILVAIMAFGVKGALADVGYEDGAPVYRAEHPYNTLGLAADFGVFAETIDQNGHIEANIACKYLINWQDMHTTCGKVFYIQNFAKDLSGTEAHTIGDSKKMIENGVQNLPCPETIDVYVGSNYSVKNEGNDHYAIDGDKIVKFSKSGDVKELTFYNESSTKPFIDIDQEFITLRATAGKIAGYADTGVTFVGNRADYERNNDIQNRRSITCDSSKKINVLNVDFADLTACGSNDIKIYDLGKDSYLYINVTNLPEKSKDITLPKIYINGNDGDRAGEDAKRVIWNFGEQTGDIRIEKLFAGTVLAPNANVNLCGGDLIGSSIAKSFKNGAEVHQIPYTEPEPEPSEVTVTVKAFDGTCCDNPDERIMRGVKLALYKNVSKDGNKEKYKLVKKSTKPTSNDGSASWTIKEAGKYYIKAVEKVNDYALTPIRCSFEVKADSEGKLRIYAIEKAKEANGENNTFTAGADNTSGEFKIRYYSDSLYLAAYVIGADSIELVADGYSFTVTDENGNTQTAEAAQGLADENIMEVHIPTAGTYYVSLYNGSDLLKTKEVDAYLLPNGSYAFVEKEFGTMADDFGKLLAINSNGKNVTKIKTTTQNKINELMNAGSIEFQEMTDGCMFFNAEDPEMIG
ncbi:MAG: choice-of-anchor A family protein [Lachnospiraceae bacterium]|nr:choice-of-anchor A family protein [Lachnospiraceae bacterium]